MTEDRRIGQLRGALTRARARVAYCRAELERFDRRADPDNVMLDRPRARLAEDLRKAEEEAGWAEVALADASSPMEVPAAG